MNRQPISGMKTQLEKIANQESMQKGNLFIFYHRVCITLRSECTIKVIKKKSHWLSEGKKCEQNLTYRNKKNDIMVQVMGKIITKNK